MRRCVFRKGPELLARHRSLQLRRKKSEVLTQLPPKTTIEIVLQLDGEQRTSYERAEREGISPSGRTRGGRQDHARPSS